jgi:hypothetical protein
MMIITSPRSVSIDESRFTTASMDYVANGRFPYSMIPVAKMSTLRYEYSAEIISIDTDLAIPGELARRCHGARETTFAADYLGPLRDGPEIVAARIQLCCEPSPLVVVELTTSGDVTDAQDLAIRRAIQQLFESDWNYEFDLPVGGCQVHFETWPRAGSTDTTTPEIVDLAMEWPAVTYEQMAALSDEALATLLARLHRVAPVVRYDWSTPERATVRSLLEAAERQQQHRALDRIARERGTDDDVL